LGWLPGMIYACCIVFADDDDGNNTGPPQDTRFTQQETRIVVLEGERQQPAGFAIQKRVIGRDSDGNIVVGVQEAYYRPS